MFDDYNGKSLESIKWFLLHCLIFSCISILTKYVMQSGISIVQILAFQTCTACLLLPLFRRDVFRPLPARNVLVSQAARALLWLGGTCLFFLSLDAVALPRAMALSFSTPLFTITLAILILKEVMRKYYATALLIGFGGMVVLLQPGFDNFKPEAFMVIAACVLWSITDIIIKRTGKLEKNVTITWFYSFFSFILLLPILPLFWSPMTWWQIAIMVAIGGLFLLNIMALTYSYRIGELTVIQPFAFTNLIFVSLLSYIVFDELIAVSTFTGGLIIVISTSFIAYSESKRHKEWLAYRVGKEVI